MAFQVYICVNQCSIKLNHSKKSALFYHFPDLFLPKGFPKTCLNLEERGTLNDPLEVMLASSRRSLAQQKPKKRCEREPSTIARILKAIGNTSLKSHKSLPFKTLCTKEKKITFLFKKNIRNSSIQNSYITCGTEFSSRSLLSSLMNTGRSLWAPYTGKSSSPPSTVAFFQRNVFSHCNLAVNVAW
ncbi:hypothetical protein P5673_012815 [Acropora cervicornis]|uniref:Uncharacterized protein n=1 Tax=Acropora cervicornis TaxID=6130 RepID=A0AAD9QMR6_ACRCE|nr:hypothetical protein P5673_012815 [Acropora cervicornis]